MRAEWEGFVAVVDKKMSEKTNNLVNNAQELLSKSKLYFRQIQCVAKRI